MEIIDSLDQMMDDRVFRDVTGDFKTIPMMAWQLDADSLFLDNSFDHPVAAGEGDSEGTNRDP